MMFDKTPCAMATAVSKPEKQGSGRSAMVDYLVTTTFDGGSESLVRRTFEDFQWIQDRLVKERMGIIVPVLSTKVPPRAKDQLVEPFITIRQESLDRFLQRVIGHPELVDAPSLVPFFTSNPTDWEAAKANAIVDKDLLLKENTTNEDEHLDSGMETLHIDASAAMHGPVQEGKKGPLGRWFTAKRTQWALQSDNLQLEQTPAEAKKFHDMKTYADKLEVCIRIISEDYKEALSSQQVLAEKTETIGAAFAQMWGEHELSNTSSSTMYQKLGKIWANVSHRMKKNVTFGERYFETPVDDLLMDIVALQDALVKRKEAVYSYTKLAKENHILTKQLDRMKSRAGAQQDKYYKLETELQHLDTKIAESRNHSDLVTTRLEKDIERFRVEWHERMRQVLEAFHKEQVAFFQGQVNDFSSVLPALASLETERSDLAKETPPSESMQINLSYDSGGAKASVGIVNPSVLPPEMPPPPVPSSEVGEAPILSLNSSFSSDDGFETDIAMGGDTNASKPIVKSV